MNITPPVFHYFLNRSMNPEIRDFMQKMGFGNNYKRLENYYFENLFKKISEVIHKKLKMYVWQEIFDDSVKASLLILQ